MGRPRRDEVGRAELLSVARFRFAIRRFERQTDVIARRCGLTPQRYLLLLAVATIQPPERPTVSSVARDLEMPQTTVTDLVARAVGVGLLDRGESAEDRRVTHLELTAEGRRRLNATIAALSRDRTELARALRTASSLLARTRWPGSA